MSLFTRLLAVQISFCFPFSCVPVFPNGFMKRPSCAKALSVSFIFRGRLLSGTIVRFFLLSQPSSAPRGTIVAFSLPWVDGDVRLQLSAETGQRRQLLRCHNRGVTGFVCKEPSGDGLTAGIVCLIRSGVRLRWLFLKSTKIPCCYFN